MHTVYNIINVLINNSAYIILYIKEIKMQASKISVDKNLKETVKHGTSALPIAIYELYPIRI